MTTAVEMPDDMFSSYTPTSEEQTDMFMAGLRELSLEPGDLAAFMRKNGDYREFKATIRSIQRMASGESRVSSEMMTLVNMLVRQHRRLKARYSELRWQKNERGVFWAQIEDWFVYISPQTRGRWILSCSQGQGPKAFSPPFGRWLNTLDEAKNKALACVEEGMNDVAEFADENASRRPYPW